MRISREDLKNLRKNLIDYCFELEDEIDEITNVLIDYPNLTHIETNWRKVRGEVKSSSIEDGHDCWGKSEWINNDYIRGMNTDIIKFIAIDSNEYHLYVSRLDIEELQNMIKEEFLKIKNSEIESFDPLSIN